MPKETPPNPLQKSDQPFVLSRGELSKKFRILTPAEIEKLGLTKNKPKSPERRKETGVSIEQAKEILGEDVLGPEAVEMTFGFSPENIPPIPFSAEELERAKELKQFLELRVDRTADGKPLDMNKMHELLQPEFTANNNGKILNSYGQDNSWYKNEDFLKDVPRASWVLVSKDVIPNSLGKNFLQQTEVIANYLKTDIFKDQEMPEVYKEAVEEFEAKKAGIQAILTSNWQEAAKQLSELKINQLTRQLPVETMYDFLMYFKNNKKRLLESKYTWTYRRASDGRLVGFGDSAAAGAHVNGWAPDDATGDLGVAFSRSL
ncbi:MAG: hypothetical protein A3B86_00285 [Candidatus Yanofskybacteria bacterium RIFCSPHIGHO2_02_FULL_38_22b]|uniref:Uncharacterized protein n=1 Tax=Candidatus Yanofskybacteria bacterium RIFCSPHIGHO2_02_FULL_38_22b TaxID=1802673 RepID=A0A1F8F1P9_9BACT|nr:MAG: hypothetical protein A2816_02760 [Candidatus Yanofskybacteria bacterium RIFCSPHIGHO2_01_FULL_39_44]OGN06618.1 MAG: hypothetical protein A3B86_00285 [Candidatus Yanofskybacteria bacterium RIFCSPHIGHO2_02_FULL_38_22b]